MDGLSEFSWQNIKYNFYTTGMLSTDSRARFAHFTSMGTVKKSGFKSIF